MLSAQDPMPTSELSTIFSSATFEKYTSSSLWISRKWGRPRRWAGRNREIKLRGEFLSTARELCFWMGRSIRITLYINLGSMPFRGRPIWSWSTTVHWNPTRSWKTKGGGWVQRKWKNWSRSFWKDFCPSTYLPTTKTRFHQLHPI